MPFVVGDRLHDGIAMCCDNLGTRDLVTLEAAIGIQDSAPDRLGSFHAGDSLLPEHPAPKEHLTAAPESAVGNDREAPAVRANRTGGRINPLFHLVREGPDGLLPTHGRSILQQSGPMKLCRIRSSIPA